MWNYMDIHQKHFRRHRIRCASGRDITVYQIQTRHITLFRLNKFVCMANTDMVFVIRPSLLYIVVVMNQKLA